MLCWRKFQHCQHQATQSNRQEVRMRTTIVRYNVKPARLDEHVALVKAVFEELSRSRPAGLRYSAVSRSNSLTGVPRTSSSNGASRSRPSSDAAVSARPCQLLEICLVRREHVALVKATPCLAVPLHSDQNGDAQREHKSHDAPGGDAQSRGARCGPRAWPRSVTSCI